MYEEQSWKGLVNEQVVANLQERGLKVALLRQKDIKDQELYRTVKQTPTSLPCNS